MLTPSAGAGDGNTDTEYVGSGLIDYGRHRRTWRKVSVRFIASGCMPCSPGSGSEDLTDRSSPGVAAGWRSCRYSDRCHPRHRPAAASNNRTGSRTRHVSARAPSPCDTPPAQPARARLAAASADTILFIFFPEYNRECMHQNLYEYCADRNTMYGCRTLPPISWPRSRISAARQVFRRQTQVGLGRQQIFARPDRNARSRTTAACMTPDCCGMYQFCRRQHRR